MYENDYMYAIERNDEYLAHYGIRGMKWGVRKAIASGNGRRLGRQYAKAQKKLAKLEKRAASGKKYAKRAAALGAGAAAAGGLAALGTSGVGKAVWAGGRYAGKAGMATGNAMSAVGRGIVKAGIARKNGRLAALGSNLSRAGIATRDASSKIGRKGAEANIAISKWGNSNSIASQATKYADAVKSGNYSAFAKGARVAQRGARTTKMNPNSFQSRFGGVSNNTIARAGAAAVGAGLAGAAGYNAYRAATTKRAAKKAAQFRSEMNKAFKGTQYDTNRNRQGKKRRRG